MDSAQQPLGSGGVLLGAALLNDAMPDGAGIRALGIQPAEIRTPPSWRI
jgi:hypothetical protein